MLISFNWLKQYIDLPDSVAPEEVAAKLKLSTVEVEKVERQGKDLENIVVGLVKKISKHPDADKLKVCTVSDGAQDWQVVCGGSNVREEMKVAFGKIGAKVRWHGEGELVELTKAKIRGVESFGMICASTEIGLGEMFPPKDEKEILDLSSYKAVVGSPRLIGGQALSVVLGLDDAILEIDNKSLSNRPDLWGHHGMAREVAALYNKKLSDLKIDKIKEGKDVKLKIKIEDKENCYRYVGAVVGGIKVAPSPAWLKDRLTACGVRPINNIVDVTNYVTLELGRPSHAFDRRQVKDDTIIVRRAKAGEKFTTLDGQEHELTSEMCLVCDAERPVDLGGIMGGLNSEIKSDTTEIILELANFNPANIRRTANVLGLRTEAAVRFEKGLAPYLAEVGMRRILTLIKELIPDARLISKIVDINYQTDSVRTIELPLKFLTDKIGVEIPTKTVISILDSLGFAVKEDKKKNSLQVAVPKWRPAKDISIPEDLVEEVARIYGYGNIQTSLPTFPIIPPQRNELRMLERKIKEILALEFNFTEVSNYSFVSPELLKRLELPAESFIELNNPIAKDRPFLRRNLWSGLLENAETNLHRFDSVKMFEIGKVFLPETAGLRVSANSDELLPSQPLYLGLVFASKGTQTPFYGLSEALTGVLGRLGYVAAFKSATHELGGFIHRGRQTQVLVGGEGVGAIMEITPLFSERLGISERVAVAEIDLQRLLPLLRDDRHHKPLSVYPEVVRDIAFVVDKKVGHAAIVSEIKKADHLVGGAELFDVYEGKNLPAGKKSLAYHVTYLSDKKTLESSEVDSAHAKVGELLQKKFGGEIRR